MIQNAVRELSRLLDSIPQDDPQWQTKADVLCDFATSVAEEVMRRVGMNPTLGDHMWNCLATHWEPDEDDCAILSRLLPDIVGNSKGETLKLHYVRADLTTVESESRIEHELAFCRGRVVEVDYHAERVRRIMTYDEAAQFVVFWLVEKIIQIVRKNKWARVQQLADLFDRMVDFFIIAEVRPEALTGQELQRKLGLSYNPEALLIRVGDNRFRPSTRAHNGLLLKNLKLVGDIVQKDEYNLRISLGTQGLGKKSVDEIRELLRRYNLDIGMELPFEVLAWYNAHK